MLIKYNIHFKEDGSQNLNLAYDICYFDHFIFRIIYFINRSLSFFLDKYFYFIYSEAAKT